MKNKYWLWMIGVNILGIIGYKLLTSVGASKAYDFIADEIDTGDTVIMTKSDGTTVVVKKVRKTEEE